MQRYSTTYEVFVGDDLGSPTFWNTRFQDIDLRLNAVESFALLGQTAADDIINIGVSRIDDTLQPMINSLTSQVNALNSQVSTFQATIISDQNSLTSQLNALIDTAQGLVDTLENLGTVDGGTF